MVVVVVDQWKYSSLTDSAKVEWLLRHLYSLLLRVDTLSDVGRCMGVTGCLAWEGEPLAL